MRLSDGVITILLCVLVYLLLRAGESSSTRVTTAQSKYCYEETQAPNSLVNIVLYDTLQECISSKKLYRK